MDIKLAGRSAVVCGSSQGIGRAIAHELADLGASVTVMARNPERLESVVRELNIESGQKHGMIVADFSEPAQVKMAVDQFSGEGKSAEILVNNTGGPPGGQAISAKPQEFLAAFESHLVCNHLLTTALTVGMKKNGFGRIINIISTSVKQPIKGLGVSNTIRGAVANWAKTLAGELGPHGITVNNVLPGMTRTARLDSIIQNRSEKTGKTIDEVTAEMVAEIPSGRIADAAEIAAAVAFLASPAAGYINGINLPVDGGRTGCL
ncbi:MAG: SDR family oxidoreductase [Planctomycetota bacterium]